MDNNKIIVEYLQNTIAKYSQGLIFWNEKYNNIDNTPERAKECKSNIQKYSILYNEFNSLIHELRNNT